MTMPMHMRTYSGCECNPISSIDDEGAVEVSSLVKQLLATDSCFRSKSHFFFSDDCENTNVLVDGPIPTHIEASLIEDSVFFFKGMWNCKKKALGRERKIWSRLEGVICKTLYPFIKLSNNKKNAVSLSRFRYFVVFLSLVSFILYLNKDYITVQFHSSEIVSLLIRDSLVNVL